MARRYWTTNKLGEEKEVSRELAIKLMEDGKKTREDFRFEGEKDPAPVSVPDSDIQPGQTQSLAVPTQGLEGFAEQFRVPQHPNQSEATQESIDQGFVPQSDKFKDFSVPGNFEKYTAGMDEFQKQDMARTVMQAMGSAIEHGKTDVEKQKITDQKRSDFYFDQAQTARKEGTQNLGQKAADVILSQEVMSNPDKSLGTATLGALSGGASLLPRTLGWLVSKIGYKLDLMEEQDIRSIDTMLFKPLADDLNDWVGDRENQNKNLDSLADQLESTLKEKGSKLPHGLVLKMQDQIDDLRDQKNSEFFTGLMKYYGGGSLSVGSDPLFLGAAARETVRRGAQTIVKSEVRKELQEFKRARQLDPKITKKELQDEIKKRKQENLEIKRIAKGNKIEAKAIARANKKAKEGGTVKPIDVEFARKGGGETSISELRKEGLSIDKGKVTGVEAHGEAQAGKVKDLIAKETDVAEDIVRKETKMNIAEEESRKNILNQAKAKEVGELKSSESKLSDQVIAENERALKEAADIQGIKDIGRQEVRGILKDTPKKLGSVEESASVNVADIEEKIKGFHEGLTSGDKGIASLNRVDEIMSQVTMSKATKSKLIKDMVDAFTGRNDISEDIAENLLSGNKPKKIKKVVDPDAPPVREGGIGSLLGQPKTKAQIKAVSRPGTPLSTTTDIENALKNAGVKESRTQLAGIMAKVIKGDAKSMKEALNSFKEIIEAGVKVSSGQFSKDAAKRARALVETLSKDIDDLLKTSLSKEKYANYLEMKDLGGKTLGAKERGRDLIGVNMGNKGIQKSGEVGESIVKVKDAIKKEAKRYAENGLKDTSTMTKGTSDWVEFTDYLGKDKNFIPEIKQQGAKIVEEKLKKFFDPNGNIKDPTSFSKKASLEIVAMAKPVDKELGTTYGKNFLNAKARYSKKGVLHNIVKSKSGEIADIEVEGVAGAKKSAEAIKKSEEAVKSGTKKVEVIDKDIAKFDKNIEKIIKSEESKLKSATTEELANLKLVEGKSSVPEVYRKEVAKAIKDHVDEAIRYMVDTGEITGAKIDILKTIDKRLGTTFLKKARASAEVYRFELSPKGKIGLDEGGSPLPHVSLTVAPLAPGSKIPIAMLAVARQVVSSLKKKDLFRIYKALEKGMSKKAKSDFNFARSSKDLEAGKRLLTAEMGKGDFLVAMDRLTSKGAMTYSQLMQKIGREEYERMVEKGLKSKDLKIRAAAIKAKKPLK